MTVYALAQLTINDRARYDRYAARFRPTLHDHHGRLLAADEAPQIIEGVWDHDKVVLIAFPDHEHFERWARSDAYQRIATDRTTATNGTVLLINGGR